MTKWNWFFVWNLKVIRFSWYGVELVRTARDTSEHHSAGVVIKEHGKTCVLCCCGKVQRKIKRLTLRLMKDKRESKITIKKMWDTLVSFFLYNQNFSNFKLKLIAKQILSGIEELGVIKVWDPRENVARVTSHEQTGNSSCRAVFMAFNFWH